MDIHTHTYIVIIHCTITNYYTIHNCDYYNYNNHRNVIIYLTGMRDTMISKISSDMPARHMFCLIEYTRTIQV